MKKKQLVAVFVMMLAAATMATACQTPAPKAKDALKYLDKKYSEEGVINLEWSEGSDYDTLTYKFLDNFKVNNGFEMEVYADEGLTQLEDQEKLTLEEGNNDFWIVVFKAGKNKDDKSAHTFKVNIYKPVTVNVITVVNGAETEVLKVKEGTFIPAPSAPTLPQQQSFIGWYVDEACQVPYEPAVQSDDEIKLYAKVGEGEWVGKVKIFTENLEDDDYTQDTTVDTNFVGQADKSEITYTKTGFTLDRIEENGDDVKAYYKRNRYTVTLLEADDETAYATIKDVKHGALPDLSSYSVNKADDGETVFTFNKWVDENEEDPVAVTGNVTYFANFTSAQKTYTFTETIEGASITITEGAKDKYLKNDEVSFTITVEDDYNRSVDYTIKMNGNVIEPVEGVYTITFPGEGVNVEITAEGIEQNTYVATLSASIVNADAEFAKVKNAEDVILYVDGEARAYDDLSAIEINLTSGDHVIEFKAGEEVLCSKLINVEAGCDDKDLVFGTEYLGYYDFVTDDNKTFYKTAEGLTNSLGGADFIPQKNFWAGIDPTAENFKVSAYIQSYWEKLPDGKNREQDPGYGYTLTGGGVQIQILFMKNNNVRLIINGSIGAGGYVGWNPISLPGAHTIDEFKDEGEGVTLPGAQLSIMKRANAFYVYSNDDLLFVMTAEGIFPVAKDFTPAFQNPATMKSVNEEIGSRVATMLASDDLKCGLYFSELTPYNWHTTTKVTKASYTDDAEDIKAFDEYGSITYEMLTGDDYIVAPIYSSVKLGSYALLSDTLINRGDVNVDLNEYFVANRKVGVQFFNEQYDIDKVVMYKCVGGIWDEGTDVTDSLLYVNDTTKKYNLVPEKGVTYKFAVGLVEATAKTEVRLVVQTDDVLASGVEYSIYNKTSDALIYTSTTQTIENSYNGIISLPVGEYYIVIETMGNVFGKYQEFTVEENDSGDAKFVEVNLEKNIWGTSHTFSGTTTFDVDVKAENVAETFSLTHEGVCRGYLGEYNIEEKLNDGEMISFSLKFNEGQAWNPTTNSYLNADGWNADTYIKISVDKADGNWQEIGLTATGAAYNGTALNTSPFIKDGGMEAQYVKDNPNLDIVYDIAYARVGNEIHRYVKYHDVEEWTLVGKWVTDTAETKLRFAISCRGGYNLNFTLSNFALIQDKEALKEMYIKNLVSDGPISGESGTKQIDSTGEIIDVTAGTLTYEQTGDFLVWDTDTIGDISKGKMVIEGNFSGWGNPYQDVYHAWKDRHQGMGFILKQMSTGKFITMEPSYQTGGELLIQVSSGNGWPTRACLPAKINTFGENLFNFNTATKENPAKYYMRAEVEGYNWKIWIGKSKETIDFSMPTWIVNMYDFLSSDASKNGHGSGSQWSGNTDNNKNREDKFPFIMDTADGKYKAESSSSYDAGVVALGYVCFGDGSTKGGKIENGSINYFSYEEIEEAKKGN